MKIKLIDLIYLFILLLMLSGCDGYSTEINQLNHNKFVTTTKVNKTDVIRYYEIPAVFIAQKRADLSFQLSGTIDKVLVKIGEEVDKDQVLMSLYNPNLSPILSSNLASLESVKVKINQAKRDLANLRELRKNNTASRNSFDHKETELKDLIAQKKSINAQVDLAQANQKESLVSAPFSSIVVNVNKQIGEFTTVGSVVITLNQTNVLEVEVNVTRDIWKSLLINDMVIGLYDSQEFEFKVIERAQMANSQSHLMKIILQLEGKIDGAIGQQVMMNFPHRYKNVYKMPLETVVDDGINKPYIFTSIDGIAQKNPIIPLYIEGNNIIFTTANDLIDPVVIKGQSKLAVGMKLSQ